MWDHIQDALSFFVYWWMDTLIGQMFTEVRILTLSLDEATDMRGYSRIRREAALGTVLNVFQHQIPYVCTNRCVELVLL